MIPKIIHYCWLSGEPFPQDIEKYINSWRKQFPDFEFKLWDKSAFNINSVPFVEQACSIPKWAFAADYIRLYALYNYGGIYLDVDVEVLKSFDEFLDYDFFTSMEYHYNDAVRLKTFDLLNADGSSKTPHTPKPGICLQAAVMGSCPKHPFVKQCLDFYNKQDFILPDGSLYNKIIAPDILAMNAEDFGFKFIDKEQELSHNMHVLPSWYFAGCEAEIKNGCYAIHHCAGSWREKETITKKILKKIYRLVKHVTKL